jgi:hypothetical protein
LGETLLSRAFFVWLWLKYAICQIFVPLNRVGHKGEAATWMLTVLTSN